ncbi:hypothetical protein [Bacillus sp. OTU530]
MSIGVATYPDSTDDATELMCKADDALYKDKN